MKLEVKNWRAATLCVCLAVLAANAWHLSQRRNPPTFDDAWYLEESFRLFHSIKKGPLAFAREYVHAFRIKAPLVALLPLPLYALAGPSERAAPWANQFCLLAGWAYIFLIARRLYGEEAALAAVVAAALMPLLYGLSRVFYVEGAETAAVAAAQWSLLSARPGSTRDAARLGLWMGLGLLLKSLFPLYVLASLWLLRRNWLARWKIAAAVAGAIAATWYAFNGIYVVGFGLSAGFGRIGRDYGLGSVLSPAALGGYFHAVAAGALSWPYCAAAAVVFLTALAAAKRRRLGPSEWFLLSWLAPFLILLTGVNKEIRYIAPILPALAVALGAAASAWPRNAGALTALLFLLALPARVFCAQTFGLPPDPPLAYNGAPDRDPGLDRSALVERLRVEAPADPVVAAVAVESPRLNANNLSSLAAERDYPIKFINLGYAQDSLDAARARLRKKGARYIVFIDGLSENELPPFLNRVNDPMRREVERGGLGAKRIAALPLSRQVSAEIYSIAP